MNDFFGVSVEIIDGKGFVSLRSNEMDVRRGELWAVIYTIKALAGHFADSDP